MENLIIKGNEIKEPGIFGKTIYVIKGKEIREPGILGRTAYIIDGKEIKETGFGGKTLFIIEGDKIKKYYKKTGILSDVLSAVYHAKNNANVEKEKSDIAEKDIISHQNHCENSYVTNKQINVQAENRNSQTIEEIIRQNQIRERLRQEQERKSAINKKYFLIIGCIVVVLLITIIIFTSQLTSLWYFTELNKIEFHEEFANGIKMAKTKLIISGIAIAVEIFLIIKCNRKRKREIN